jgi:hypothetical protein
MAASAHDKATGSAAGRNKAMEFFMTDKHKAQPRAGFPASDWGDMA